MPFTKASLESRTVIVLDNHVLVLALLIKEDGKLWGASNGVIQILELLVSNYRPSFAQSFRLFQRNCSPRARL